MVGYAKKPYSFTNLAAALEKQRHASGLNTASHGRVKLHSLYQSIHKRKFDWLENHGIAYSIAVSHLWLAV